MEKTVELDVIETILKLYDLPEPIVEQKTYMHAMEDGRWMKLIFRVTLAGGRALVIKLVHEDDDFCAEMEKVEKQSRFSEIMRCNGIQTPVRYQTDGRCAARFVYHGKPCIVTVEDWCGEAITEMTTDLAYRLGILMARMHTISLANRCEIGHGTLFSAAWENDVDVFPRFCKIAEDERLEPELVRQIITLRNEKLEYLRAVWETLPKAAVQGDLSINNLVRSDKGLVVFDYNNAGDEVLISDLVMEGLLTAYEMDLPDDAPESCRETIFPALLKGYRSVRSLNEAESKAAWEAYTLYHGLWFTRIVYRDGSLEKLVQSGDYDAANRLLKQMLEDMRKLDDGRFRN